MYCSGVKIPNLPGEGHPIASGVEPINRPDAAGPGHGIAPGLSHRAADGRHKAQAGDYHSTSGHTLIPRAQQRLCAARKAARLATRPERQAGRPDLGLALGADVVDGFLDGSDLFGLFVGISVSNSSSRAMTNSTVSKESAPRSSTKDASSFTSSSFTPSCSQISFLTRSSTLLMLRLSPNEVPHCGAAHITDRSQAIQDQYPARVRSGFDAAVQPRRRPPLTFRVSPVT